MFHVVQSFCLPLLIFSSFSHAFKTWNLSAALSMSHVTVRQWMRHTTFPRYSMQEKQSFDESALSTSAMSNHTDVGQRSLRGITYSENIQKLLIY